MYSRYGRDWNIDAPEPLKQAPEPPSVKEPPVKKPPPDDGHRSRGGLSSMLSRFKDMDKGDMLLLAVLVFLLIEGEDIEIVVLIALVLFLL